MLPKEIHGATRGQLAAIGFKFGADVDDLFVHCELPVGWTKEGTSHSMHSNLLDEQGRKRASIFFKAAFYDCRADMTVNQRYRVNAWQQGSTDQMRRVDVVDGDKVIKEFGETDRANWSNMDLLRQRAEAWLSDNYPAWKDPMAYW